MTKRVLLVVICLLAAYWPVAYYTHDEYAIIILSALSVATGVGVAFAWAPVAKKAYDADDTPLFVHILGIVSLAASVAFVRLWGWIWRAWGSPMDQMNNTVLGWLLYVGFLALCMMLWADRVVRGQFPTKSWKWIGITTAIGMGIAFLIILLLDPLPV